MSDFLTNYLNFCRAKTPSLGSVPNLETNIENIISPEVVKLDKKILQRARRAVQHIYDFAHNKEWQKELRGQLSPDLQAILDLQTTQSSVLMGYDFHYDPAGDRLALIEINTNSSMYLPTALLYEFHKLKFADDSKTPLEKLRESFMAEWQSSGGVKAPRVAIIDEDLDKQKMYFEFLMYKDLFESWGWSTKIVDVAHLNPRDFDFIYNRFVDFYFSRATSSQLLDAWLTKKVFVSPHPREYLLLADKERLVDYYNKKVDETLLPTERILNLLANKSEVEKTHVIEDLWARRKHLFFKPRNMYGGKAAFRGNTISRGAFAKIFEGDFIAQEYVHASEYNGKKFDLRFFVYRNEIQNACARIYIGQTTNFHSPGGGVAVIQFE